MSLRGRFPRSNPKLQCGSCVAWSAHSDIPNEIWHNKVLVVYDTHGHKSRLPPQKARFVTECGIIRACLPYFPTIITAPVPKLCDGVFERALIIAGAFLFVNFKTDPKGFQNL
jgi:O-acetyl-ADP-ribose deacetylase (regulator of RNase III)